MRAKGWSTTAFDAVINESKNEFFAVSITIWVSPSYIVYVYVLIDFVVFLIYAG